MTYRTNRTQRTYILGFLFLVFGIAARSVSAQVSSDVQGLALSSVDPRVIAARVISYALGFLGIVVLCLILYGGFLWMTAAGNEETIEKAKKVLTNSVIGLAIILTSFGITRFIISRLLAATGSGVGEISISTASCPGPGCPGFGGDGFFVRGITPKGSVPLRNVVVRAVFNRAPNIDSLETNVTVARKDTGAPVPGTFTVSGTTVEFRPVSACPSPNQARKCFDGDTDFSVRVLSGMRSASGQPLTCSGQSCTDAFHTGNLVDVAPPSVTIESPDSGASVPVDSCTPLQAHVRDDAGVSKVEFYDDGILIEDGTIAPQDSTTPADVLLELPCYAGPPPAPASHRLTAKAYDVDDNNATSSPVTVVVRPLHCFNGARDESVGETQIDCGDGCGSCDGTSCTSSDQCAGGVCSGGTCTTPLTIQSVSPGDGRQGTWVTIVGKSFGAQPGVIKFNGLEAHAPSECAASSAWLCPVPGSDYCAAIVTLPNGATTGPVSVEKAGCAAGDVICRDASNDTRGPLVPGHASASVPAGVFEVNEVTRPGLCTVTSPPGGVAAGRRSTEATASGARFGSDTGSIYFSGISGSGIAGWTDTRANTAVPTLTYGTASVQVQSASGIPSNAVPYIVLSPDTGTLPLISKISCANAPMSDTSRGGKGTGCTIQGAYFGSATGTVWFVGPDGRATPADVTFPSQCGSSWWSPSSITVKVPEVLDARDNDHDGNTGEVLIGAYTVYVQRYDNEQSESKPFTMSADAANEPVVACILPAAGPRFTPVSVYGDRFGNSPASGHGVVFTATPAARSVTATGWAGTAPAVLTNVGGVSGDACPSGGWSGNEICAQVPNTAIAGTGDVLVQNNTGNGDVTSNPIPFKVGSCTLPTNDPNYINCGDLNLTCCGNGTCNSQCGVSDPHSAYGWEFSTNAQPVIPEVKEQCDTVQGSGHPTTPPSPSPRASSDRELGSEVCTNAAVSVQMTQPLLRTSLSADTIAIQKCTGAENILLQSDATFNAQTTRWGLPYPEPAAGERYFAITRDEGKGRGSSDADPSNFALHLEKLDDDTGPGWAAPNGVQQNFEHWFGYQITPPNLSTNGSTYTISAWLKASGPEGRGKRAGVLLQRKGDSVSLPAETPGLWQSVSHNVILSDTEWKRVSATITFDTGAAKFATGYGRIFLEGAPYDPSEPAEHRAGDFGIYVDDVELVGNPCTTTESLGFSSGTFTPVLSGTGVSGFTWWPNDEWSPNTWYRVVLKGGTGGIRAIGESGAPMAVMEEGVASCGDASAAYCFQFKTRNAPRPEDNRCRVGGIAVAPNPWTAHEQDETIHYAALPVDAVDPCIALNPAGLSWSWDSSDTTRAHVEAGHTGHTCSTDADCAVGPPYCDHGFCVGMPWTTTATATAETDEDPVQIRAHAEQVTGQGELLIAFTKPEITSYWPNCGEACRNAEIGARFSTRMFPASIENSVNVALWAVQCGNGVIDKGEDCDDGNTLQGDGCSPTCRNEGSNFTLRCGNGVKNDGEDCDDNNTLSGDGCSSRCLNEGTQAPTCGNGTIDPHEECDDSNTVNGDGCSDHCLKEGTRNDLPICGNGRLERGEECEIGNDGTFPAWCDGLQTGGHGTCLRKGPENPLYCGNGAIDPGEECDPNSALLRTSAERALCTTQCQWTGTQRPSGLGGAGCGNGRIELGEDCDDGNVRDHDGCSSTCLNEGSVVTSIPACGNGRVDQGEECDDSNVSDGDGCSSHCINEGRPAASCANDVLETGESCNRVRLAQNQNYTRNSNAILDAICSVSTCLNLGTDPVACAGSTPPASCGANKPDTCGNGVKNDGEDCDDGNAVSGDGCSSHCLNEGTAITQVASLTPAWNDQTRSMSIALPSDVSLLPHTTYQVLLRGEDNPATPQKEGLYSCRGSACLTEGKPLSSLNFHYNWASPTVPPVSPSQGVPNTFSWTFETKDTVCAVQEVAVNPPQAALYVIGGRQAYSATPKSAPDACNSQGQVLTSTAYNWTWATADKTVATIEDIPSGLPLGVDTIPTCGNGRVERGEGCDDGNTVSGDGCSGTESFEPHHPEGVTPPPHEHLPPCIHEGSVSIFACGNLIVGPGEECDPPGPNSPSTRPTCSASCQRLGSPPCTQSTTTNCCGNRVRDPSEDCDDGNSLSHDGCSAQCTNEGSTPATGCGDGTVSGHEECDPREPGVVSAYTLGTQTIWGAHRRNFCDSLSCLFRGTPPKATCGNGILEAGESCDDGNVTGSDGCSANCVHEGSTATCGNGHVDLGEDCDDGNRTEGDGCSARCLHEGAAHRVGDNNIDPYQYAVAQGLRTSESARGWSATTVEAGTESKVGSADLTVYCVAQDEHDCPTPGEGPSTRIGRGTGNCCYPRPMVDNAASTPTPGQTSVCRNGQMRLTFDQELDPQSLNNGIAIAKLYPGADACPEDSRQLLSDGSVLDLNLLRNGGFEDAEPAQPSESDRADSDTILGWSVVKNPANSGFEYHVVHSHVPDSHGGTNYVNTFASNENALAAPAPNARSLQLRQTVTLAARTTYQLSAWVWIEDTAATSSPFAIGAYKVRTGAPLYVHYARGADTPDNEWQLSNDWEKVTLTLTTEEAGEYTVFLGNFGAHTAAYFDDVALRKVSLAMRESMIARLWHRVTSVLKGLIPGAEAETPAWCIPSDLSVSVLPEAVLRTDADGVAHTVTSLTVQPSKLLDPGAHYKLIARGDTNLYDTVSNGVRGKNGVYLAGIDGRTFETAGSATDSGICTLDEVRIDLLDGSTGFSKSDDHAEIRATGWTLEHGGQPIQPVQGYSWTWSFGSSEHNVATVSSAHESRCGGTLYGALAPPETCAAGVAASEVVKNIQTVDAGDTNGTTMVNAMAGVTSDFARSDSGTLGMCRSGQCVNHPGVVCSSDAACGAQVGTSVIGTKEFTTLLCEHPWPNPFPFTDSEQNNLGGGRATNFSTSYCRDGAPLLPELNASGVRLGTIALGAAPFPLPPASYYMATGSAAQVLKEFLFTNGSEAIDIRVMQNPGRMSALGWYRAQGLAGNPVPYAHPIDGYETIQDGNTVYIAATNAAATGTDTNRTYVVYGNVYLVSLSEGASAAMRKIYDQMLSNLRFNTNVLGASICNTQFCSNDLTRFCSGNADCTGGGTCVQKPCDRDLDCAPNGDPARTCDAPRPKLRRDLTRVEDITKITAALKDYHDHVRQTYPTLESGTYIRSLSTSRWPSWQATLSAALGTSLPNDPINLFGSGCEEQGFDTLGCWNEQTQTYRCPRGSHVYQYQSQGGISAVVKAEFELAGRPGSGWTIDSWPPTSSDLGASLTVDSSGTCTWTSADPNTGVWSNSSPVCGNHVLEGSEQCEPGSSDTQTVSFGASLRCTGAPAQECSTAGTPCTIDGVSRGVCEPLSSCVAIRSCKPTCNWNSWGSGGSSPVVADCSQGSVFCGNGVRDDTNNDGSIDEICDDGLLNGQYGKCNTTCTGPATHCGDGIKNGSELCDRQTYNATDHTYSAFGTVTSPSTACVNGEYGCCAFDCGRPAEYCGDRQITGSEACDLGDVQTASGRCITSTNTVTDYPCTSLTDCAGVGVACAQCIPESGTGYTRRYERLCGTGCNWGTWSDCVSQARCGNGIREGNETCDYSYDSDSTDDANHNDIADGNEDGCTNDCHLATCGDHYNQGKVCFGNAATTGKPCTTNAECGQGGTCQDREACDQGSGNGTLCLPTYGGTGCTYCDHACTIATRSGGFCGDHVRSGSEQCDGTDGLSAWRCVGSLGTSEAFERFETIDGWAVTMARTTRIEFVHPGDSSASALRLTVYNTENEGRAYNAHANVLPAVASGRYVISARVKASDARAVGKAVRIQNTTGAPTSDGAEINLTAAWQTLEATVSYSSGPATIALVLVQSEAQAGGAYGVDIDNVHISPISVLSCNSSGSTACQTRCATGLPCNNTINASSPDSDGDTIADQCDNDKDGDGDPSGTGDTGDCNDANSVVNHDAQEICSDGIDNNCNGATDGAECVPVPLTLGKVWPGRDAPTELDDSYEVFLDGVSQGQLDSNLQSALFNLGGGEVAPGTHTVDVRFLSEGSNNDAALTLLAQPPELRAGGCGRLAWSWSLPGGASISNIEYLDPPQTWAGILGLGAAFNRGQSGPWTFPMAGVGLGWCQHADEYDVDTDSPQCNSDADCTAGWGLLRKCDSGRCTAYCGTNAQCGGVNGSVTGPRCTFNCLQNAGSGGVRFTLVIPPYRPSGP